MLSLTLILTLILAADVPVNKAFAQLDLQNILQALQLQLQQQQEDEQHEQVKQRLHDNRYDDDDNDSRFGSLRPQEVENLIQDALNDKDEAVLHRQEEPYAYEKKRQQYDNDLAADNLNVYALWRAINKERDDQTDSIAVEKLISQQEKERKKNKKSLQKYQQSYLDELNQILLLDSDNNNKQQRHQSHQAHTQLRPNDLLGDSNYPESANRADVTDLNEYSKIYVVLNVDAVNTSKNKNRLTDLVSSLLNSASSSQRGHREAKKDRRYKGFVVHDSYRKANAGDGLDTDLDYKPKRPRAHDGGRTPIPYIRHRGDIYEKDK